MLNTLNIFSFLDYKDYINKWILSQNNRGYGMNRKISEKLNVNPAFISQVLRGDKHFNYEQGYSLSAFMGLTENERDYFLDLLMHSRAGSKDLSNHLMRRIEFKQKDNQTVKSVLRSESSLSDAEKSQFYSEWYYSAVRLLTSFSDINSVDSLQEKLNIDRTLISKVLKFLIQTNLVVVEDNKLNLGSIITHIDHESPYVNTHHRNWRLKSLEKLQFKNNDDLFFTGPLTISHQDHDKLRLLLLKAIENTKQIVEKSPAEKLLCMNIDLFAV